MGSTDLSATSNGGSNKIRPSDPCIYSESENMDDSFSPNSSDGSVSANSRNGSDAGDGDYLAFAETRAIRVLRGFILAVLLGSGIVFACVVIVSTWKGTIEVQQVQLQRYSQRFGQVVPERLSRLLSDLDVLATDFSIEANRGKDANPANVWPFVIIPNFEERVSKLRVSNRLMALTLLPKVDSESRMEWIHFSKSHRDQWLNESLENYWYTTGTNLSDQRIRSTQEDSSKQSRQAEGPVNSTVGLSLPLWQTSPPSFNTSNSDMNGMLPRTLSIVLSRSTAVVGETLSRSTLNGSGLGQVVPTRNSEPLLAIAYPIPHHNDSSVAAVVLALMEWRNLFEDILVEGERATLLAFGPRQSHTFRVDGSNVSFLDTKQADNPNHDEAIDISMLVDELWSATQNETPLTRWGNGYFIQVHPSSNESTSTVAYASGGIIAVFFVFVALLFFSYDRLVQRRQRQVAIEAHRSSQIVKSLFPARVRERLFLQQSTQATTSITVEAGGDDDGDGLSDSSDARSGLSTPHEREPPKRRLRRLLRHHHGDDRHNTHHSDTLSVGGSSHAPFEKQQPIADLFPCCTVLFADIAGFTAWSSERDPTQVFTLLQQLYRAMDTVARKLKVFKVETIGDSYVAVTGLPDPQADHALIMANFALHCRIKMRSVTRKLERTLGPDTANLDMRFGLHSGPVTAGVLVGERARFQLFGDTVNTAARMESTGMRNCIQVSEATATLLKEAGKGHWVIPREGTVSVKGKGEMQTYWLEPQESMTRRSSIASTASFDSADTATVMPSVTNNEPEAPISTTPSRGALKAQKSTMIWGTEEVNDTMPPALTRCSSDPTYRLIDWNVDVLLRLLKQVVVQRSSSKAGTLRRPTSSRSAGAVDTEPAMDHTFHVNAGTGRRALDEVTEIIALPSFDPEAMAAMTADNHAVDLDSIDIDEDIEMQLRDYVTAIASMYRDNPFHNYEHACHVQMSMIKLLQRVVTPDDDVENDHGTTSAEEMASHVHRYTYGITSDPLTQFAVVFCALIHDVDHTGVANGQLIKENSPVALYYDGKSVAEQNSIDLAWELLMDVKFTELRQCIFTNGSEYQRFRQLVVNIVLATDIFDPNLSALRKNRWSKAFDPQTTSPALLEESMNDQINRKATIVLEHLIQASDVSHTMQHWDIYKKWNEKLFYEMRLAYQSGRTDKDPADGWHNGELWFFDNYVIPLAKKLKDCGVFGVSSDECLNYASENRRIWSEIGHEVVAEWVSTDYMTRLHQQQQQGVGKNHHHPHRHRRGGRRRHQLLQIVDSV